MCIGRQRTDRSVEIHHFAPFRQSGEISTFARMCGFTALGFLPEMSASSVAAAVTSSLELIATEQPQLLEFQLEMLLNSPARDIVLRLAKDLAAPHDRLGVVLITLAMPRRCPSRNTPQFLETLCGKDE